MTIPVNIRMEIETRDQLNRVWLRLKSADPATTQGDTLSAALTLLEEHLDGKVVRKE